MTGQEGLAPCRPVALRDEGGRFRELVVPQPEKEESDDSSEKEKTPEIRCPRCRWRPGPGSLWMCADCDAPEYYYGGCWTRWNSFDTGGRCPGCGHQWVWTACLACGAWSRHADWYVKEP